MCFGDPAEIGSRSCGDRRIIIVDKGAAFERVISSGLENADQVEVLEGLKAGDQLVIKGFETLRNRSKVKIVR